MGGDYMRLEKNGYFCLRNITDQDLLNIPEETLPIPSTQEQKNNNEHFTYFDSIKRKVFHYASCRNEKTKDVCLYVYEMIIKKDELRSEQMKLTLFSINRCIDFFNDFTFLIKLIFHLNFFNAAERNKENIYKFILLWYSFFFITSLFTFFLRRYYILNVIPSHYQHLFCCFRVFKNIKSVDHSDLAVLYHFDRIQKTYILINKFFEDIPQFFLCLLYMIINGKDHFLIFNIIFSLAVFLINTIELGFSYPFIGTFFTFFAIRIPDDARIDKDAAPTNRIFCLYSFFVFFFGSLVALISKNFVSFIWIPLIYVQFCFLFLTCVFFLIFFFHLQGQYQWKKKLKHILFYQC